MNPAALTIRDAIVTGASSGIGLSVAQKLIQQGVDVHTISRRSAESLKSKSHLSLDMATISDNPALLDAIDVTPELLILNAGTPLFGGLEQLKHADIVRVLNVNLLAPILLTKALLPRMKRAGRGKIIIVGSESSLQGAREGSVYCASKFGLRGFAQSLRADCSRNNIAVSLVNPGPTSTSFFDDLHFEPQQGQEFSLNADDVAKCIMQIVDQPEHMVAEEINLQAMKRSFQKK